MQQKFSPPSSTTSSPEAPTSPALEFTIRPAESEADALAIHRFLLVVAQPVLLARVDAEKSLAEVWRVVKEEAAFMAFIDDRLVGTVGITFAEWWYGEGGFLTDRWNFTLPELRNGPVSQALLDEADRLAAASDLLFIQQGKTRRDPKRGHTLYTMPRKAA